MAFGLNRVEAARRDGYANDLRSRWTELEAALATYNEQVTALREPLETALKSYNDTLDEARGFVEDIAATTESQFDDKSEKWQEGDRGQAVAQFRDEWQAVELDDLEIEFPEELSLDDPGHGDALDGLSVDPDYG